MAKKNIGNCNVESFLIPITEDSNYINNISLLLNSLDDIIEIKENKFLKYKEQKKYLLNNMFI